jgi:hypothetical protein
VRPDYKSMVKTGEFPWPVVQCIVKAWSFRMAEVRVAIRFSCPSMTLSELLWHRRKLPSGHHRRHEPQQVIPAAALRWRHQQHRRHH